MPPDDGDGGTPTGYLLKSKDAVDELMAIEADLLRSESIDPAWPGFDDPGDTEPGPQNKH